MARLWYLAFVCALTGCVEEGANDLLVPPRPFSEVMSSKYATPMTISAASEEIGKNVAKVGQKIVLSNRDIGLRPQFTTIGAPDEELFHLGRTQIVITEGLVNKCQSEDQLAALLCRELARMVVEREALTTPSLRKLDRPPPMDLPVGNDHLSIAGSADATHRMELAKYEREQEQRREVILPSPDALAREYLKKAGYRSEELDEVTPLLRKAEEHSIFEKQMSGYGRVPSFASPTRTFSPRP